MTNSSEHIMGYFINVSFQAALVLSNSRQPREKYNKNEKKTTV